MAFGLLIATRTTKKVYNLFLRGTEPTLGTSEVVRDLDLALPTLLCNGAHLRPRALHALCLAEHAGPGQNR